MIHCGKDVLDDVNQCLLRPLLNSRQKNVPTGKFNVQKPTESNKKLNMMHELKVPDM
jgi:hypothetical protein